MKRAEKMDKDLFYDDETLLRLCEAIVCQLQQDYANTYKVYLQSGPGTIVHITGDKKGTTALLAIRSLDNYIKESYLTADHSEAIIEELRRQGAALVNKNRGAYKSKLRKYKISEEKLKKKKGAMNEA